MNADARPKSYRCLAGHEISASRLAEESEIVVMDGRAEVRICREHGCPVGESRPAASAGRETKQ